MSPMNFLKGPGIPFTPEEVEKLRRAKDGDIVLVPDPKLGQDAIDALVRAAVVAERRRIANRMIAEADEDCHQDPDFRAVAQSTLRNFAKDLLKDPQGSGQENPSVLTTPAPPAEGVEKAFKDYQKGLAQTMRTRAKVHRDRGNPRDLIAAVALDVFATDLENGMFPHLYFATRQETKKLGPSGKERDALEELKTESKAAFRKWLSRLTPKDREEFVAWFRDFAPFDNPDRP